MDTAAGWYTDPSGKFPHRYWDGSGWTEHVSGPQGNGIDPLPPEVQQQQQVQQVEHAALVFEAPTLALHRFDDGDITHMRYLTPDGALVLDATEELKEQADVDNDSVDELTRKQRTTTMRAVDATGTVVARVVHVKPWKSDFTITDATGMPLLIGKQENVMGAPRYSYSDAGSGQPVAMIRADSSRARAFSIEAPDGSVVATLDKLGSYDTAALLREARQQAPIQTPGQWLYDETFGRLLGTERDKLRFALTRPQPVPWEPLAMVVLTAPMMMELSFSVL